MFKIEFISSSKEAGLVVPAPKPAKTYLPKWYQERGLKNASIAESLDNGGWGVKACVPFKDAMVTGYIQETWTDINITFDEEKDNLRYDYATGPQIIHNRDALSVELDKNYYPFEFLWRVPWIPKVPKGYSVLITHPLNHSELPFTSTSGIVDADDFYHAPWGNYPFYIKKGFSGIIPAGTPMFQIIPFKRDNWLSEYKMVDDDFWIEKSHFIKKHFIGAYKKFFYKKKVYK